jgi:hypothetical protein
VSLPLQGGAVNFSTADHTDTDGYAPLFWRLRESIPVDRCERTPRTPVRLWCRFVAGSHRQQFTNLDTTLVARVVWDT